MDIIKAAQDNDLNAVRQCLLAGESPNKKGGNSPLYMVFFGFSTPNYEVIKLLIENGADVNSRVRESVIQIALKKNKITPQILQLLIDNGVKMNQTDKQTPLIMACANKYSSKIVEMILSQKDTKVNASDGWDALHYACQSPIDFTVIQLLVKAGANVNARTNLTPLHIYSFASQNSIEVLKFLFISGANPNYNAGTPFHFAIKNKLDPEKIQEFLRAGANSDILDKSSVLHCACDLGSSEIIIKMLLAGGANPNLVNKKTPLQICKDTGRDDLVQIFQDFAINPNDTKMKYFSAVKMYFEQQEKNKSFSDHSQQESEQESEKSKRDSLFDLLSMAKKAKLQENSNQTNEKPRLTGFFSQVKENLQKKEESKFNSFKSELDDFKSEINIKIQSLVEENERLRKDLTDLQKRMKRIEEANPSLILN
ncbi:ankyrin repeat ph and sec7 domain containing protein secg-related [Anaeramoeba ignava]|uniref:Ankyrin repeat ph and sec7 domain containing protein secg-related n=1 Tax=Anaeramoeba ignava TaxID=1746090 RepID=A0A9Q0LZF5_ANAIG|nr:ankyrin repeat ph and sec7 domain containing protein secg-related [Anaeramoeba ignava]